MQTGQLPTAPLNTENVRVWQRVAEADDGSAEQKIPQYHRAGQQWGLYAARIPMAWEITMGSSDVRVLLQDQWWGPSSNGTIIPYGITTGIGLNPSNGETGSGRGDLVMKIRQKQSDGSFAILDDALQNSGPNGNILVFEKFDASTQTWVQELGAATGTEYSLRLSNYGHGVQCLSIMASALNAKGMIGVAPGCSYMLGDGDLKAPLLYDFDPTVIGMQTAHVVSSQTSLDWGHQLKQSSYIAVGAGNLIGASHFQYYDGLSNETIYKGCIPVEKRVDVGAWLDTRSIKAGVWNDGILIRDNSNVGITKECTTFDRRRIDLAKTNLSSPYYYWHQQKYPPATLETPSNIQYKTSGTCGTNGDIADGCYRMLGLPLGFPGTEHVDVFKYVDVVVPSSILCEGSGELYKQHETAQSYVIPFLNGIIALMRSVDITGGVNVTSELYPYTYGTACNEEFMAARPIYTNSKLQTTNKTVTRCELHRRGRDIITFTARKVPNKDYKYTVQEGDPMRRSWVYNNGYGLVDAYRCVANSIPAKGKNIYGNNDQLDFANGTEIGGKKYLHLGAWGRFDNAYDNNSLLFDTPAYGFVPEGFGAEVSCGKTVIGSSVYTVGTGNVACIDGIVESYTGGSIKTVANTNGRILFSGYFKSTGVIEGNLSLGDVVIRTGKIKLVPSTGMECRIYGEVTTQFESELVFSTSGTTKVYPGASLIMQGSKDLIIEGGAMLDLDYGCDIKSWADNGRKLIIRSGGKIVLKNNVGSVNIDADVEIEDGGTLELGSTAESSTIVHVRSLKVVGTGKIKITGRGAIEGVLGSTTIPNVDIANTSNVEIVAGSHFDLSFAKLILGEGAVIKLVNLDTFVLDP